MQLGADGIYVELAGEAFELRPSLRATTRLVRRHGLPALYVAVQDFNVTVIADMLREAGIRPALLLAEIAAIGLGKVRFRLTGPLTQFVLAVAGIDPDDTTPSKPATGKPMTLEQFHTQLFETATGGLGWAPEEAWNATTAEIVAAYKGQTAHLIRTGMLVEQKADQTANHYSPERLAEIEAAGQDPEFDRAGLMKLKALLGA